MIVVKKDGLNENIRKYRHGMFTQSQVAGRLGMSQSQYSRMERGVMPIKPLDLLRIAEILRLPVRRLLEGS